MGDDKKLRIVNFNTMENVEEIEAHRDYIRSVACHPTQPLILTCSDDFTIKLWEYNSAGKLTLKNTYDEHQNFVMCVKFNPKDPNYFASCSVDSYIKMWNVNSTSSNYTLRDHAHSVNCIDFNPKEENVLVSCSDDKTIKIWDLQLRKCTFNLTGQHADSISSVAYHPELPYILSGSEDKTVILWNTNTMKKQQVLNHCNFYLLKLRSPRLLGHRLPPWLA